MSAGHSGLFVILGAPAWQDRSCGEKSAGSRSSLAWPNICRFSAFNLLIWPSTGPVLQRSVSAALTVPSGLVPTRLAGLGRSGYSAASHSWGGQECGALDVGRQQ